MGLLIVHKKATPVLPEVGMMLSMQSPDGEMPVRIVAMDDENLTLDANHPLAGEDLVQHIQGRPPAPPPRDGSRARRGAGSVLPLPERIPHRRPAAPCLLPPCQATSQPLLSLP